MATPLVQSLRKLSFKIAWKTGFFHVALAVSASAQVWDGGAGTGNWGDALNWSTNVVPVAGANVQFGGLVQPVVDLGADRSLASLTFNAGATAFTLNNNRLSLTGAGTVLTNSSSSLQTINSELQFNASRTVSATSGALVFGGDIFLSSSAANNTLTVTGSANTTITGVVANGGTSTASGLTKTGTGTLTLSGANTYGGLTTLSAGVLRATTSAAALGSGNLSATGGTLSLANDTGLAFGRNTAVGGTVTFVSDRLTAGTGVDHSLGTLTTTAARTINLNAGSNVTGGVAGLTFGQANVGNTLTTNTGAGAQLTLGPLNATAARTLIKTGTGTLVLSAPPTAWVTNSNLQINNGTARLGAGNALGATALTNVTVNATTAGATALFDLAGNNQSIRALTFGGTGATTTSTNLVTTGAGTLTLGGDVTYSATNNPLGATLSGNLNLGAATRTFAVGNSTSAVDDLTVAAAISGGATIGLTKTGTGTLVLSGASTYGGATTLSAGILKAGAANAFSSSSAFSVASGTTLDLNGYDQVVGSLAGAGTVSLGAGTLSAGGNGTSTAFTGAIGGAGGLEKAGAGTLTLSTANSYTGATTVSAGVLRVSNATALGTAAGGTAVASGASLEFSGGLNFGSEALTLAGTGVSGGGAVRNLTTGTVLSGAINLTADALLVNTVGTLALNGAIDTAGNVLTFGGAGTTTLTGALGGASSIGKVDAGSLVFGSAQITTGSLFIGGGTVGLGGYASTFDTLHITADSVLDFGGTSSLTVNQLVVDAGVKLTITGWADAVDYFLANNDPGAVNLGRVEFTGFSLPDTKWLSYNKQLTPVPEPSAYGALLLCGALGWCVWRRRGYRTGVGS